MPRARVPHGAEGAPEADACAPRALHTPDARAGSICLYHLSCERPLLRFDGEPLRAPAAGATDGGRLADGSVESVQWVVARPGLFWALRGGGRELLAFDLFRSMQARRRARERQLGGRDGCASCWRVPAVLGASSRDSAPRAPQCPWLHVLQEPVLRQQLSDLNVAGEEGLSAVAFALAPQRGRAGRAAAGRAALAIALENGRVAVHALADEFCARPGRGKDEARAEWKRKLRELETFVA